MDTAARRVALVTGANRGIGLETSRQLLEKGLTVVLAGRDLDALERARRALPNADRSSAVRMDVADAGSIADAHAAVTRALGAVDILVNNAAVLLGEDDDVLEISRDDYRSTFDTSVFGIIEACRVFVPDMVGRRYGRIVNVSSGVGQIATLSAYAPAYALSKVVVNAFTRMLAQTCQGSGVLANAVDPGWVRTDMGGPSAPRSPREGADTITWLATLPDSGPTGGFFRDRRPIAW